MRGSFQDQLLQLGIAEKQKAEAAKKEKHQQKKAQTASKNTPVPLDENALLAKAALEKKQQRARQLNQEREEKLRRRELEVRIQQIIESQTLPQQPAGSAYRFADKGKIYRVFVEQRVADLLSSGGAVIVRRQDQYAVVPAAAAAALRQLNPALIVLDNAAVTNAGADADDPYRQFQVPDDLVW